MRIVSRDILIMTIVRITFRYKQDLNIKGALVSVFLRVSTSVSNNNGSICSKATSQTFKDTCAVRKIDFIVFFIINC